MPPNPKLTNSMIGPLDWLGGMEVCKDVGWFTYIDPSGCGYQGYPSPVSGKLTGLRDTSGFNFIDCNGFSTIQECMANTKIRRPLQQAYNYYFNNKSSALILDTPHRFCSYSADSSGNPLSQIDLRGVASQEGLAYSINNNTWNGYITGWGFMPIKEYDIDNGTITYDNDGDICFEKFLLF